jgi:hypothetical protein
MGGCVLSAAIQGQQQEIDADGHSREKLLAGTRLVLDAVRGAEQCLGHVARRKFAIGVTLAPGCSPWRLQVGG